MFNAKSFLKLPLKFKFNINVYPPSVTEVLTTEHFSAYRQLLTISQEDIEDKYNEEKIEDTQIPTPMEYLLFAAHQDQSMKDIIMDGIKFFIHEEVTLMPEQKVIIVGNLEEALETIKSVDELRIIKEEDYLDFQNLIRKAIGDDLVEKPDPNEDPRKKKMRAKARLRDRVKAKQEAKKGDAVGLDDSLVAICCMGFGLNPLNIGEISYAAVSPLIKVHQRKEEYKNGVSALLAGAKAKDVNLKQWIRKIDEK